MSEDIEQGRKEKRKTNKDIRMKGPLRFIRVRQLELRTYCPTKKKSSKEKIAHQLCPSCFLPLVVAFIFIFTVSQLIVIHRTIEAYKLRNQAYTDCYSLNNGNNDSKTLQDLAFAQNFIPSWPNENHVPGLQGPTGGGGGSRQIHYPYNLHRGKHNNFIEHNWAPSCAEIPANLRGNISIDFSGETPVEVIMKQCPNIQVGGIWAPLDCNARARIAVIIPFRDRWKHLRTLLSVLHPMLQRQQLAYQIFVVEQYGNYTFNKGVLMNAAFLLALNQSDFDCVVFHDVDLIPEDDRNLYTCASKQPRHLSVAVDAMDYRLPYASLVGGVFSIRVEDFVQVNGYSNLFWGWGGEDDDIFSRLLAAHLQISRPGPAIARYKMLHHGRRLPNKFIAPLIRTSRIRFPKDGLTTCKFRVVREAKEQLYTHYLIDLGYPYYVVHNKTIKLTEDLRLPEKYLR